MLHFAVIIVPVIVYTILKFCLSKSLYKKWFPNQKIKDDDNCDVEFGMNNDRSIDHGIIRQRSSVTSKDQPTDANPNKLQKEYNILPRPIGVNKGHNNTGTHKLLKQMNSENSFDILGTNNAVNANNSISTKMHNQIQVNHDVTEVSNKLLNSKPLVDLTLNNSNNNIAVAHIVNNTANTYNDMKSQSQYGLIQSVALKDLSLEYILGGGAFGQVWKGTWNSTPVAVKILSSTCQNTIPQQILASFEEEVRIISSIRHPNICLFLAACLEPPSRAIITELVIRGSLWDVLRIPNLFPQNSEYYLPTWIIRKILDGTCKGLTYLHNHNPTIIHRDLKSANILLDESFNVKICDFGLAKLLDYSNTMTANVGTVQWMAPEVLRGQTYTEKVDVYSVGIITWEILTGKCPFEGKTQLDIALAVSQYITRPEIPPCSDAVKIFLHHCWHENYNNRYSASEVLINIPLVFY